MTGNPSIEGERVDRIRTHLLLIAASLLRSPQFSSSDIGAIQRIRLLVVELKEWGKIETIEGEKSQHDSTDPDTGGG